MDPLFQVISNVLNSPGPWTDAATVKTGFLLTFQFLTTIYPVAVILVPLKIFWEGPLLTYFLGMGRIYWTTHPYVVFTTLQTYFFFVLF